MYILDSVKRETGASPVRTRRCKVGVLFPHLRNIIGESREDEIKR